MQSYHLVWLEAHPHRTAEWLRERLADGFHVHHVDGDHSNDDPRNLILIDGADHLMLHAGSIAAGIKWWRKSAGQKGAAALAAKRASNPQPPRARKRVQIKRAEPLILLNDEMRAKASECLSAGGTVSDAARALGHMSALSWRARMAAVRREVLVA